MNEKPHRCNEWNPRNENNTTARANITMSRLHRVGDRVRITRGLRGTAEASVSHVDAQLRRYCLHGYSGAFDEARLLLIEPAKPNYFLFKTLLYDCQGCVGVDRVVVYNCIFAVYEKVTADDKEFWGARFKTILPQLGKWLEIMQDMKNECKEYTEEAGYTLWKKSYKGNYTVDELAQLPAATLYDVFIEGAAFDCSGTVARLEQVQVFE